MSLPPLEKSQYQAIQRYGLKNYLYQANKLPSFSIPRTKQYYIANGLLMGFGIIGYAFGKKYKLLRIPFAMTIVGVPLTMLVMQKELDSFYKSSQSRRTFQAQLQYYPQSKEAYEIVKKQYQQNKKQKINMINDLKTKLQFKKAAKISE